jgi:transposase
MKPEVRPLPDAAARELTALVTRHRQLVEMMTAKSNRRDLASKISPQLDQFIAAIAERHEAARARCKPVRSNLRRGWREDRVVD